MKQLLVIIVMCTTLACQASDKLSQKELEKQFAIRQHLAFSKGTELLCLVKQHAFLRSARVTGPSAILSCIRNNSSLESPYPTQEVQALLEIGVDIDQEGTGGRTALHEVSVGDSIFSELKLQGLLEHKADPTKQDRQGYNALGIALMSGRSDINILTLVSQPSIAAMVNQPMRVHTRMTTPLNAVIVTPTCVWRKKIIKKLLATGALITAQDICDSLEPNRHYETLLKRSSLAQLTAALPLVEHHRYDSPLIKFSKKRELCKAIKAKIDTELPELATPAFDQVMRSTQESKQQPPSYQEAMQQQESAPRSPRLASIQEQAITPEQSLQPGYRRSVLTEYFKGRLL